MRTFLGCGLLILTFSSAGLAADEKIDAKKLLGKWQPKEKNAKLVMEFAAEGKFAVTGDFPATGTWKLDGDKLTLVFKVGENETKDTITITKLTDDELVAEDAKKEQMHSFKRIK